SAILGTTTPPPDALSSARDAVKFVKRPINAYLPDGSLQIPDSGIVPDAP
ncbi:hypothetical protein CEXT_275951, partial [Caerostris extrusa]